MSTPVHIVFYSKFSPVCNRFLQLISTIPSFYDTVTMICVDNETVRKRVISHKTLSITEVPSVIRVHPQNGYAEAFEGKKAFEIIGAYAQPQAPQLPVQPQPPQSMLSSIDPEPRSTPIDSLGDYSTSGVSTYHPISTNTSAVNGSVSMSDGMDRAVKKQEGSGGNIVSRAMQMQKERETESTGGTKPMPYA